MSREDNMVVGSKIKDKVKALGCQSAGDLVDEVNKKLHALLQNAAERAKQNGRATVRGYDL